MVGLSDIPCVGKFVDRISDAAVNALFRELKYMFCYKKHVDVLNSEIKEVNIQKERVSAVIVQERRNGKIIKNGALKWQKDVDNFQETAREFSETYKNRASWTCLKCLPIPHPLSRFRLGRDAELMAKEATELVVSGKKLLQVKDIDNLPTNEIAHSPPTENLPTNEFQEFASRKGAYGELWEALKTESSSLILGIYGIPGVGKTQMMEQISNDAMEKKIFNKVARAYVGSEGMDKIKLQDQIAKSLNCKFESEDNVERRAQLKYSLMHWGKVLIILDDVWSNIPLEDIIGTSFGESSSSKGSKILLTSRSQKVCSENKCTHLVQITTLTDSEAWDLFQNTVGTDHIDRLHDETLAKKVCTKCAGLPLLIRAVGKALQFMNDNVWKDALQKLENGNFKNIHDIDPQVYACVKWSIDRLPEDAKLCLFLCSLFPEDAGIDITKLILLAIGSQFIPRGESAVRAIVDILVISTLLLKVDSDYHDISYKLHDIIRDVASNIFFGDPIYGSSHVQCDSRLLRENAGFSTLKFLRLDVESDHVQFPVNLVCTDMSTLWLRCNNHLQQFSGDFFNMFVNLRFLMLQNVHFCSDHFSLQPLSKLEMLIFDKCEMRETNVSLFPKKISTLCIWGSKLPSPLDITNLEYLQKLDIRQRYHEVIMVPNTISSLSSLEELHIPYGFRFSDDTTPTLDEIDKLTRLTSLKIFLNTYETCDGTSKFLQLLRYEISARTIPFKATRNLTDSTKIIELGKIKVKSDGALQSLMERAEEVELYSTEFDASGIWNSDREGFAELRTLRIERCDMVEYIARISQDEIQHSRERQTSFSKLTILKITGCNSMKYLFCKSVATCLVQLQELKVKDCPAMEVIVMNEDTSDGEIINFPKLERLTLDSLDSLTSFYKSVINFPKLKTLVLRHLTSFYKSVMLFDGKVAFPCLEYLKIRDLRHIVDIWGEHYNDDNNNNNNIISSSSFCKLKSLVVEYCSKLESIIPHAMLHRLGNLETLRTWRCRSLRNTFQIIGGGDNDHAIFVFPALTELDLYIGDESNTSFQVLKFPNLETLYLSSLGKINLEAIELGDDSTCRLKTLEVSCSNNQMQLPSKWQPHLYNLESLTLTNCWWRRDDLKSLRFPNLTELEVSNCGCSSLFTISGFRSLQKLKTLEIRGCDLLEEIVKDSSGEEHDGMDAKTITLLELNTIKFNDLPKLKSFIHGANYECQMPALQMVTVYNCGLSSLFTISVFRNLQHLERLEISNCAFLKEIVKDVSGEDNDHGIFLFPALTGLTLSHLKNLSSIGCYHNAESTDSFQVLKFPNLETLRLTGFGKINFEAIELGDDSTCRLKTLEVSCSDNQMQLPSKWQPHVYNLESLSLTHWWWRRDDLKSLRFPNLTKLEVSNCGCSALFTISAFRSLQKLQTLKISVCNSLEKIVEDVSGEEHAAGMDAKTIIRLLELNTVEFYYLPNLKSFIHGANYECQMPALQMVTVDNCGLSSLFTISVFRNLQHLERLKISKCAFLEEIVEDVSRDEHAAGMDAKTIIRLLELNTVEFYYLPNLKSFIHGANYECQMPALQMVTVDNCGLSSLFTISVFRNLQHLERLEISKCAFLEEIVEDVSGEEHAAGMDAKTIIRLLKLNRVEFKDLPRLKSFIHGANYECQMPDLQMVTVDNCGLSSLFTISVFRNLQHLRRLEISKCAFLEEIVEDVSGEDNDHGIMVFPALTELTLSHLENLSSIGCYHNAESTASFQVLKFPNLETLRLTGFGKINFEAIELGDDSTCRLKTLEVSCSDNQMQLPSKWQPHLYNLESLSLTHWWWRRDDLKSLRFPNLTKLEVSNCGCSALFTISAFRSLQKLQTLKISVCNSLEKIVEDVSGEEHAAGMDAKTIIRLLELNTVEFEDLPNLKSFIHGANYECQMPALQMVTVDNCGLSSLFTISVFRNLQHLERLKISKCAFLEEIVEDVSGEDNDHGIFLFPALTVLRLSHLENLSSIGCYHNAESTASFQVLKFPNLETLRLTGFGKINFEAIELGDDSTCRLKTLEVSCSDNQMQLPSKWQPHVYNLESLSLTHWWWRRDDLKSLRFPNLTKLEVSNCGCSALFTISAFRSLQNLRTLKISGCELLEEVVEDVSDEEHVAGMDAKTIIRLLMLNRVEFKDLPKLKSFIHGANYECQMPALQMVTVNNCGLSFLFTISAFRSLQKLKTLKVSGCDLLEEVVEDVSGEEHAAGMDAETIIRLLWLYSVEFKDLPKLKSFIHGANYECYMPALKEVEVDNCGLSSLFTCSVFRNLQRLDTLKVLNCQLLEDIVNNGRGDKISDTDEKGTIPSQLSVVTLKDLPKLKSFSRTINCAFSMPELEKIHLLGCPQLENFTYSRTITGLVSVYSDPEHEQEAVTDLNDFIIQNRKRSNLIQALKNQELETESGIVEEEQFQEGNRG